MPSRLAKPILRLMVRAGDEYWDSDRASYEDELNAFRERTAGPVAVAEIAAIRSEARRPARRPVAVAATRDRRPPLRRSRSASRRAASQALAR
jgi:hypothetical protein